MEAVTSTNRNVSMVVIVGPTASGLRAKSYVQTLGQFTNLWI